MKDDLLGVKIVDGKLTIEIGVSALCHAVTHSPYLAQFDGGFEISDEEALVEAICLTLLDEKEDGSTLVYRMFDKAAENAIEDGCDGIEFEDG